MAGTIRPVTSPRALPQPEAGRRRAHGVVGRDDHGIVEARQVHLVPEVAGEGMERSLGVVPRAVEPAVHGPLHTPTNGLEQGGDSEGRRRHGDRVLLRQRGEEGLDCRDPHQEHASQQPSDERPRDRARHDPVDLVQPVAEMAMPIAIGGSG